MDRVDVERVARRVRAIAGRPAFCDPRHLAVALGYLIRVDPKGGPPRVEGQTVVYPWHADQRERGWFVFVALARALCREEEWPDCYALALARELAAPAAALRRGFSRVAELQQFAPVRVVSDRYLTLTGT